MIIDMKYHVASLAAVFIALGIGILVGTTIIGSDTLMHKQEILITSLQEQYNALRDENRRTAQKLQAMQQDAAYQKEFNRQVMPALIRDKLVGHRVAVIDLNYRKGHETLNTVLKNAGAELQSVTVVSLAQFQDSEVCQQVASTLGKGKDAGPSVLLPALARFLGESLNGGAEAQVLHQLEDKNILRVTGDYGTPVHEVVLIGGSAGKDLDYARFFDLQLIAVLQKQGVKVFGAEDSDVQVSYMRYYQGARLTTVDDIDNIYGQVALVQAMSGYPGNYGVKQTAQDFLPPL